MQISKEEATELIVPFSGFVETMTKREVYGKMSKREREQNRFFRNLLQKLIKNQDRVILDEVSSVKCGILDYVSVQTRAEMESGTYTTGDPEDDVCSETRKLLSDIVIYFSRIELSDFVIDDKV
ncbi:hypothetical protein HYT01_03885 [Candidatus Giovannonibacteria bacterium]|nr:hypothetical protein [Candidatus Giovannonibacteria bacterium]